MLVLKIARATYLKELENAYVNAVDNGEAREVKITTNKLELQYDRKDARYLAAINNVKLIYRMRNGCLILMGSLSCSYRQPFGGEFYVRKAVIEEKSDYDQVNGVEERVLFTSMPMGNEQMREALSKIAENENLVFNLSQFDEFMELFEFYKSLSSALNNNAKYSVITISDPYYFVPIEEKEIPVEEEYAVRNLNDIVIGYRLERYKYEELTSDQQDRILRLIDVTVKGDEKDLKKIRSFSENLYFCDDDEINSRNERNLNNFDLKNAICSDGNIVLSGEPKAMISQCKYLHLYDMGQKVKIESIDNSLRLINQGASGAAAEMLEYIIGDKTMPSASSSAITPTQEKYIGNLNESQRRAFLMATDGSPVSLIKGPPGTGKTHVINAIVQYITKELKQKVVISSQTHVAIDNVLDKIMENYDPIIPNRITNRRNKYSGQEIDTTIYKTWGRKFEDHNRRGRDRRLSREILQDMAKFQGEKRFCFSAHIKPSDYSVIGATTTTSAIGGKKGLELFEGYDWLIIDEVSKCPITEVLRYLPYVKKIIMVGDDFQLAPLLEFRKEDVQDLPGFDENKFEHLKYIYEESVFAKTLEKAKRSGRLVVLNENYRSVKSVLNAYNVFYDGALIGKREEVRPEKVRFNEKFSAFNEKDIFFVDVKNGKEAVEKTSRYNVEELCATREVLKTILENTLSAEQVTVSAIFPYSAQIEKFQRENRDLINEARKKFKSFELDTVDAFQGRETDIVLVNTVVTDPSRRNFLNDFRRINVSMSRARDKLFIFGNPITLSQIDMKVSTGGKRRYFADIIADIRRFGQVIEYKGGINYASADRPKIELI